MDLRDATGNSKSHAAPLAGRFCGKERLENLASQFLQYARSVVSNLEQDMIFPDITGKLYTPTFACGISGIHEQIQEGLMDFHPINIQRYVGWISTHLEVDLPLLDSHPRKKSCILTKRRKVDHLKIEFPGP